MNLKRKLQWIKYLLSGERNKVIRRIDGLGHDKPGLILFLGQFESVWNKSRPVFAEAKALGANCKILIVPDEGKANSGTTVFEREFPDDVVFYHEGIIDELKPSVVVLSRPYDHYLPDDLRTDALLGKAHLAFIPYFYGLEEHDVNLYDKFFLRRLSYFFADQPSVAAWVSANCDKEIDAKTLTVHSLGYPVLEEAMTRIRKGSFPLSVFTKNPGAKKVLWTPRWNTDGEFGGSNFTLYKEPLFRRFVGNADYSFAFRPHPLLFKAFIEKGLLTEAQRDGLIAFLEGSDNAVYDHSGENLDTLFDCDLLITDSSSIVSEYALTGKPMVYCMGSNEPAPMPILAKIQHANYVVRNEDELNAAISLCLNGKDEKKAERQTLAEALFHENEGAALHIAKALVGE